MAKITYRRSEIYDKLTVILVARNLQSLQYPFIESMWSAIPLGCRYLVGNAGCDDMTMWWLDRLSHYMDIEVVDIPWDYDLKLHAIGVATHELAQQVKTPLILNLQANEVLTDESPQQIKKFVNKLGRRIPPYASACLYFRHFWGNCNFEGTIQGNAYNMAQRISTKNHDYRRGSGDGCYPDPPGGSVIPAVIHRYSYCFENQLIAKTENHAKLFKDSIAEHKQRRIRRLRERPNYTGEHPYCVRHLLDQEHYNYKRSIEHFVWMVNRYKD